MPIAIVVLIAAAAAGAWSRDQSRRPMHVDEAVHAFRLKGLIEHGQWEYDPHDFHGPMLNYASLASWLLAGRPGFADWSEGMLRVVPVAFGVGLVLLLLLVADGLGRGAIVAAAAATAVSPAFGFYCRYYIMEIPLVFFTFAAIATGWRFTRSRKIGWAIACGASLGLMHATKETFVINVAAMAGALVAVPLWRRLKFPAVTGRTADERTALDCAGEGGPRPAKVMVAVLCGAAAAVLFSIAAFSGGFRDWGNVLDSVCTYASYAGRAGGAGLHEHPWHYYVGMLTWNRLADGPVFTELPTLLLAIVGGATVLRPGSSSDSDRQAGRAPAAAAFRMFMLPYAVLLFAIYSAIPYKTPWTMLSAYHAALLLAGVGVAWVLGRRKRTAVRAAAAVLIVVATGHLAIQSWRASFQMPADPRNPYAYAQPTSDLPRLAARIEEYAAAGPDRLNTTVKTYGIADDFWPLVWYLRRMNIDRIGHWPSPPADADAPIIVASPAAANELPDRVGHMYFLEGGYEVRPTIRLELLVQAWLGQEFERSGWRADPSPRPEESPR